MLIIMQNARIAIRAFIPVMVLFNILLSPDVSAGTLSVDNR